MESRKITSIFFEASRLEARDPKAAMREYERANKQNTDHFPIITIAALLLPTLATLLTYFTVGKISEDAICLRLPLSFAIQFLVGYFPVFYLRHKALSVTRFQYQKKQDPNPVKTIAIGTLMVMAMDFLAILGVLIFGTLIALPFLWLVALILGLNLADFAEWPRIYNYFGWFLVLLMGCSFYLTNMPISPYFFPPTEYDRMQRPGAKLRWWRMSMQSLVLQVPAGWIKNWSLIKQTLATLVFTYLIGQINLNLADFPLLEAVGTAAFGSLLLAQGIGEVEDDPIVTGLANLGRARCLIRLGRFASALELLWEFRTHTFFYQPIRSLAATLEEFIPYVRRGWPDEFGERKKEKAMQWIEELREEDWDLPYLSLWDSGRFESFSLITNSFDRKLPALR
ncbi:hypothetical protein ANRL4_00734 [Anaerolineae bacterium]|nr:hypothetical protein ANRL4_00734 [Anaerolineae bacterium]